MSAVHEDPSAYTTAKETQPQIPTEENRRPYPFGVSPSDVDENDPEAVREFLEGTCRKDL